MIARVDNCTRFKLEDLTPSCLEYKFCLQSNMCWSKNVLEERDAPEQIVIGSGDATFCVLLTLGTYLEDAFMSGSFNLDEPFLFGMKKAKAAGIFASITSADNFPLVDLRKPVGTHSNRKFASTYARRHGCSRDDVDARGRCKRNKRTVDVYIDVSLPYPDAKVASVLCIGGPIKYEIRRGCNISDLWILSNVVPCCSSHLPRDAAIVMGKAILWAVYDQEYSLKMPSLIIE
jgi:hypothetical protein